MILRNLRTKNAAEKGHKTSPAWGKKDVLKAVTPLKKEDAEKGLTKNSLTSKGKQ